MKKELKGKEQIKAKEMPKAKEDAVSLFIKHSSLFRWYYSIPLVMYIEI